MSQLSALDPASILRLRDLMRRVTALHAASRQGRSGAEAQHPAASERVDLPANEPQPAA
jgi:hypothetical protein